MEVYVEEEIEKEQGEGRRKKSKLVNRPSRWIVYSDLPINLMLRLGSRRAQLY